jgi:acetoin:2,6-dichlorophenolindophenol oxidoreductase subunit alpha
MIVNFGSSHIRANSPERIFRMFETMLLIREFEEAAHQALQEGLVHGSVHQSIGQEAVSVGVCSNLRRDDLIYSNHRGHGHAIAKGANPVAMMKELFGRVGGTNGGKGGSMHIADFSVGMLGANGVLADGVTMGVGAAQAVVLKGEDKVVGVFVGDGTTNRGPFYEGLNWAKVYNLPVLIICEDNAYASSTLTKVVTAGGGPASRARVFDIPAVAVDGNDLCTIEAVATELIEKVRSGEGPQFLHAKTYRVKGHVSRDVLAYRAKGETEIHWQQEPIGRCEKWLIEQGVSSDVIAEARASVKTAIAEAVELAKAAPFPDPKLAYEDVQDVGAPQCRR